MELQGTQAFFELIHRLPKIALRATNGNLLTAGHGKRAECVEASFQYTYADWRGTEELVSLEWKNNYNFCAIRTHTGLYWAVSSEEYTEDGRHCKSLHGRGLRVVTLVDVPTNSNGVPQHTDAQLFIVEIHGNSVTFRSVATGWLLSLNAPAAPTRRYHSGESLSRRSTTALPRQEGILSLSLSEENSVQTAEVDAPSQMVSEQPSTSAGKGKQAQETNADIDVTSLIGYEYYRPSGSSIVHNEINSTDEKPKLGMSVHECKPQQSLTLSQTGWLSSPYTGRDGQETPEVDLYASIEEATAETSRPKRHALRVHASTAGVISRLSKKEEALRNSQTNSNLIRERVTASKPLPLEDAMSMEEEPLPSPDHELPPYALVCSAGSEKTYTSKFQLLLKLALKATHNGRYVCANPVGNKLAVSKRKALSWEQFLVPLRVGMQCSIFTCHNRFWTAEPDGRLTAAQQKVGPQNIFQLSFQEKDCSRLVLRTYLGFVVRCNGGELIANKFEADERCLFEVVYFSVPRGEQRKMQPPTMHSVYKPIGEFFDLEHGNTEVPDTEGEQAEVVREEVEEEEEEREHASSQQLQYVVQEVSKQLDSLVKVGAGMLHGRRKEGNLPTKQESLGKEWMNKRYEEKLKHMQKRNDSRVWGQWKGEKLLYSLDGLAHIRKGGVSSIGTLFVTNYQIAFYPMAINNTGLQKFTRGWHVPLGCIYAFTRSADVAGPDGSTFLGIEFSCKDCNDIKLVTTPLASTYPSEFAESATDLCGILTTLLFHMNPLEAFAFVAKRDVPKEEDGWYTYDPFKEYRRLGLLQSGKGRLEENELKVPMRLVTINTEYGLCPTYPNVFIVPSAISDEDLRAIASFRSRGRVPAVVWRHPKTQAYMVRCSQPGSGVMRVRCEEDERYFDELRKISKNPSYVQIVDARPQLNAVANVLKGAGPENISAYPSCQRVFLGIANIHVVRDDYIRLRELVIRADGESPRSAESPSGSLTGVAVGSSSTRTPQTPSRVKARHQIPTVSRGQVEATGWLVHIRGLLDGARFMAERILQGISVVVHCSDGWDRTPLLVALCEIMLDPYYRTIRGFQALIEKEFCSFGHKFQDRVGHHCGSKHAVEQCPVFVQFIDSVWQLLNQFRTAFQFNSSYLHRILHHLYSCRFGTFLFNSEYERRAAGATQRTDSLWTTLNEKWRAKPASVENRQYDPKAWDTLLPNSSKATLWRQYYQPSITCS